jgi:Family of unknown function (DUF6152)
VRVVSRFLHRTRVLARIGLAGALITGTGAAWAHHSYAMFDMAHSREVNGTIAKVEWVNPHVFVWLYVKQPELQGGYDLYGFENGPIGLLVRFGWAKNTFKIGEKVTVQYFPLRDGRTGGYFIKATRADGSVRIGDPYVPAVAKELAKDSVAHKLLPH